MELKALIIGEGNLPVECADILEMRGFAVAGVCSPDDPLRLWAESRGIQHFGSADELDAYAQSSEHDFLFSIVNFQVLPEPMLRRPRVFAVNYHDGPLPRYAGVYATSWAILNREATHGITWHVMERKVDAGDILEQAMVRISESDTAYSLNLKCFFAAARSFRRLAEKLQAGTSARTAQDLSQRTYYGLRKWPPVLNESATQLEQEAYRRALDFGPRSATSPRPMET